MLRYGYESPTSWLARPFLPPQQGVYLTTPRSMPRAAILLMSAISPRGLLGDHLCAILAQGCADGVVLAIVPARPLPLENRLPGMVAEARLEVVRDGSIHHEQRVFVLLQTTHERLPVVVLGDPDAVDSYRATIEKLLRSIHELAAGDALY